MTVLTLRTIQLYRRLKSGRVCTCTTLFDCTQCYGTRVVGGYNREAELLEVQTRGFALVAKVLVAPGDVFIYKSTRCKVVQVAPVYGDLCEMDYRAVAPYEGAFLFFESLEG